MKFCNLINSGSVTALCLIPAALLRYFLSIAFIFWISSNSF